MKPPCFVDTGNKYEVIRYFRDLVNVGRMLELDIDKVRLDFRQCLIRDGWTGDQISELEADAYDYTLYERLIPRKIRLRGDWSEYMRNKRRLK